MKTPNAKDHYVYLHIDKQGQIRYVGKGKDNRAFWWVGRNKEWKKIFGKERPRILYIAEKLTNTQANAIERNCIRVFVSLGMPLCNSIKNFNGTADEMAKLLIKETDLISFKNVLVPARQVVEEIRLSLIDILSKNEE
jgi:hypothetical protein